VGLATGLTNASFNMAVAYGDVVRVILLFYLMPVWTVILARLVLHEAITPRSLARVALAWAAPSSCCTSRAWACRCRRACRTGWRWPRACSLR
jgi:EamA domain-containing membrane protein RarD